MHYGLPGTSWCSSILQSTIVSAILQLLSTLIGLFFTLIIVGWFLIAIIFLWVLIDGFLIAGWVKRYNSKLVESISSGRLV
jgi:uncharacterized membrane protein YciS (DUF1049 family)